jgi:hypothetical protein
LALFIVITYKISMGVRLVNDSGGV